MTNKKPIKKHRVSLKSFCISNIYKQIPINNTSCSTICESLSVTTFPVNVNDDTSISYDLTMSVYITKKDKGSNLVDNLVNMKKERPFNL